MKIHDMKGEFLAYENAREEKDVGILVCGGMEGRHGMKILKLKYIHLTVDI